MATMNATSDVEPPPPPLPRPSRFKTSKKIKLKTARVKKSQKNQNKIAAPPIVPPPLPQFEPERIKSFNEKYKKLSFEEDEEEAKEDDVNLEKKQIIEEKGKVPKNVEVRSSIESKQNVSKRKGRLRRLSSKARVNNQSHSKAFEEKEENRELVKKQEVNRQLSVEKLKNSMGESSNNDIYRANENRPQVRSSILTSSSSSLHGQNDRIVDRSSSSSRPARPFLSDVKNFKAAELIQVKSHSNIKHDKENANKASQSNQKDVLQSMNIPAQKNKLPFLSGIENFSATNLKKSITKHNTPSSPKNSLLNGGQRKKKQAKSANCEKSNKTTNNILQSNTTLPFLSGIQNFKAPDLKKTKTKLIEGPELVNNLLEDPNEIQREPTIQKSAQTSNTASLPNDVKLPFLSGIESFKTTALKKTNSMKCTQSPAAKHTLLKVTEKSMKDTKKEKPIHNMNDSPVPSAKLPFLNGIENFQTAGLKKANTKFVDSNDQKHTQVEKIVPPPNTKLAFLSGIENFKTTGLKKVKKTFVESPAREKNLSRGNEKSEKDSNGEKQQVQSNVSSPNTKLHFLSGIENFNATGLKKVNAKLDKPLSSENVLSEGNKETENDLNKQKHTPIENIVPSPNAKLPVLMDIENFKAARLKTVKTKLIEPTVVGKSLLKDTEESMNEKNKQKPVQNTNDVSMSRARLPFLGSIENFKNANLKTVIKKPSKQAVMKRNSMEGSESFATDLNDQETALSTPDINTPNMKLPFLNGIENFKSSGLNLTNVNDHIKSKGEEPLLHVSLNQTKEKTKAENTKNRASIPVSKTKLPFLNAINSIKAEDLKKVNSTSHTSSASENMSVKHNKEISEQDKKGSKLDDAKEPLAPKMGLPFLSGIQDFSAKSLKKVNEKLSVNEDTSLLVNQEHKTKATPSNKEKAVQNVEAVPEPRIHLHILGAIKNKATKPESMDKNLNVALTSKQVEISEKKQEATYSKPRNETKSILSANDVQMAEHKLPGSKDTENGIAAELKKADLNLVSSSTNNVDKVIDNKMPATHTHIVKNVESKKAENNNPTTLEETNGKKVPEKGTRKRLANKWLNSCNRNHPNTSRAGQMNKNDTNIRTSFVNNKSKSELSQPPENENVLNNASSLQHSKNEERSKMTLSSEQEAQAIVGGKMKTKLSESGQKSLILTNGIKDNSETHFQKDGATKRLKKPMIDDKKQIESMHPGEVKGANSYTAHCIKASPAPGLQGNEGRLGDTDLFIGCSTHLNELNDIFDEVVDGTFDFKKLRKLSPEIELRSKLVNTIKDVVENKITFTKVIQDAPQGSKTCMELEEELLQVIREHEELKASEQEAQLQIETIKEQTKKAKSRAERAQAETIHQSIPETLQPELKQLEISVMLLSVLQNPVVKKNDGDWYDHSKYVKSQVEQQKVEIENYFNKKKAKHHALYLKQLDIENTKKEKEFSRMLRESDERRSKVKMFIRKRFREGFSNHLQSIQLKEKDLDSSLKASQVKLLQLNQKKESITRELKELHVNIPYHERVTENHYEHIKLMYMKRSNNRFEAMRRSLNKRWEQMKQNHQNDYQQKYQHLFLKRLNEEIPFSHAIFEAYEKKYNELKDCLELLLVSRECLSLQKSTRCTSRSTESFLKTCPSGIDNILFLLESETKLLRRKENEFFKLKDCLMQRYGKNGIASTLTI